MMSCTVLGDADHDDGDVIVSRHRRRARELAVVEPCAEGWEEMVPVVTAATLAACAAGAPAGGSAA
jgi:hypothetical protein